MWTPVKETSPLAEPTRMQLVSHILSMVIPLMIFLAGTGVWINLNGETHSARFSLNIIALICLIIAGVYKLRKKFTLAIYTLVFGAVVIFSISTLINGGVKVPNYTGFLTIFALAGTFLSNRITWSIYGIFVVVGLVSLTCFTTTEMTQYPSPERYFTMYVLFGLITTFVLTFSHSAFQDLLKKIAKRESVISSVFESINDLLFILDTHFIVRKKNAAAEKFMEQVKTELGVSLLDATVYDPVKETHTSLRELIHISPLVKSSATFCFTIERKLSWYTLTSSPYEVDGQSMGLVLVISDMTEQQKLMHIQKMNAVGILANGIAHDFNNMIGAIKSSTELLLLDVDEEHHELLHIIEEAGDRSATLIRQLRLFSRATPVKTHVLDLNTLILDVFNLLRRTTQHQFEMTLDLCKHPLLISGDKDLLHIMIMNLGLNAIQSMTERGQIWFKTEVLAINSTRKGVNLMAVYDERHTGHYISIEIGDEGTGMSPALQERMFEPFFTTRSTGNGVGLGLATVHGAVQHHQGIIEVESQIDQGSSFFIYFPYDRSLVLPTLISDTQSVIDFSVLKVLVIDDEPLVRHSLTSLLNALGASTQAVESGQDAFEVLRVNKEYDIIILDMLMPKQNGDEVFKELQKEYAHIPVVLSSGFYPESLLQEMESTGLAGKLHKPYSLNDIKDVFTEVLRT